MTVKNTAGASRRLWIASALALACGSAWPQNAPAPNSDQPIRLVVGYAAGGPVDAVARQFAPLFAKALGQTVMVENRAGAGGNHVEVHRRGHGHAVLGEALCQRVGCLLLCDLVGRRRRVRLATQLGWCHGFGCHDQRLRAALCNLLQRDGVFFGRHAREGGQRDRGDKPRNDEGHDREAARLLAARGRRNPRFRGRPLGLTQASSIAGARK